MLTKRKVIPMSFNATLIGGLLTGIYYYWPTGLIEWWLVGGCLAYSMAFWVVLICRPLNYYTAMAALGISTLALWSYLLII